MSSRRLPTAPASSLLTPANVSHFDLNAKRNQMHEELCDIVSELNSNMIGLERDASSPLSGTLLFSVGIRTKLIEKHSRYFNIGIGVISINKFTNFLAIRIYAKSEFLACCVSFLSPAVIFSSGPFAIIIELAGFNLRCLAPSVSSPIALSTCQRLHLLTSLAPAVRNL